MEQQWRVGALAAATGLTVRALHYYDQIGLVVPSERTPAGHRVYRPADVERLYAVLALRRFGVATAEIAAALDDPDWSLPATLRRHHAELGEQIEALSLLRTRLGRLAASGGTLPAAELIKAMEDLADRPVAVRHALALLPYPDIRAAHAWLVDAFGVEPGPIDTDADGDVVHAAVLTGAGFVHLHPLQKQLRPPGSDGVVTGIVVVAVDDVDRHATRAVAHGAELIYGPTDQPYGVREYGARDLAGHWWSFQSPLPITDTRSAT